MVHRRCRSLQQLPVIWNCPLHYLRSLPLQCQPRPLQPLCKHNPVMLGTATFSATYFYLWMWFHYATVSMWMWLFCLCHQHALEILCFLVLRHPSAKHLFHLTRYLDLMREFQWNLPQYSSCEHRCSSYHRRAIPPLATVLSRSRSVAASRIWNSLPSSVTLSTSLTVFQ